MKSSTAHNVVSLPVRSTAQGTEQAENSRFWGDFGLAGIWQGFGRALLTRNNPSPKDATDGIKGLEMACKLADDLEKQEKIRSDFVKSFFIKDDVRHVLARFLVANTDRPREDQLQAITVVTRLVQPGLPVNLRDLESSIAENTADSISTTYLRNSLIPLMKEIGLIIQPKEGVNGWQWRDMEKKLTIKEKSKLALKQAAIIASPVHRELVDEQAKRYALLKQEKALKQRIALEKTNQQLITQVQTQAAENEKAMMALGMKRQVNNNPAWIAAAAVAIVALIVIGEPLKQIGENNVPVQKATMYEEAPAYNAISDEELLRLQYKKAGINWDTLSADNQQSLLAELKQQRNKGAKQ